MLSVSQSCCLSQRCSCVSSTLTFLKEKKIGSGRLCLWAKTADSPLIGLETKLGGTGGKDVQAKMVGPCHIHSPRGCDLHYWMMITCVLQRSAATEREKAVRSSSATFFLADLREVVTLGLCLSRTGEAGFEGFEQHRSEGS